MNTRPARVAAPSIAIAVGLAAVLLFLPAVRHPFAMYDDPVYVTENPEVAAGLTWASARWAFTSGDASNWHPVTWLSHLLDVQLFGMSPGPQHLVSVLLHGANAALLVLLLAGLTGAPGRSAVVALLFALHPLRVESVAWVSERKDVLSTFFALLALLAYASYAASARSREAAPQAPSGGGRPAARPWLAYSGALAAFALALMSKPMTVTLPLLMLALDAWPLRRRLAPRLIVEKIPFFALSAAVAAITVVVQRRGGALALLQPIPLGIRLQNAAAACAEYLLDFFWPQGLAVFYPYRFDGPSGAGLGGALLLLAGVTALAAFAWRARPYLAVGWAWYLAGLLPVLGVIQAGAQSRADRYTYLPLVGIAIAVVWAAADALRRQPAPRARALAWGATGAAVAALLVLTTLQLRHWRSDVALFGHAVAVTEDNWIARNNLGIALAREGRFEEAVAQHREAIRLQPEWSEVYKFHAALAHELTQLGRLDEALQAYGEVLRREPRHATALNETGVLLARTGRLDAALEHFARAVQLVPDHAQLRVNYATALVGARRPAEAAAQLRVAQRLRPGDPQIAARLDMLSRLGL